MCIICKSTQPVFGTSRQELYCKNCNKKDMKNIRAKMCERCQEHQPTFNYKGVKPPIFCRGCALDNMVDVVNPMCKSCQLFVVPEKPHFCQYCKPNSKLREKTKEMLVVNHLRENGYDFTHNKSIGFVCGNFRPDIKIDAGTHYVIVEIDEDQHSQYEPRCEIARMYNICQAEGINCIFIRYNPDVWRVDGKVKKVFTQKRLDELTKMIDKCIKEIPDGTLTVYRMFYNSDTEEYIQEYDIQSNYEEMFVNICQDVE